MSSKKKPAAPSEIVALYDRLMEAHPEIVRKGAAFPYTSLNGHMFSILGKSGQMGLRLSKEARAAFAAEHNSDPFVQHNTVMKEYVAVPADLLEDTERMLGYMDLSLEYIRSLKPKPTKRKKKT